jgi:hypothetical protein
VRHRRADPAANPTRPVTERGAVTSARHQHLERIADRYRRAGYHVTINPPATAMPPPLSWLQGDLIAETGNDHILILVDGHDAQHHLLTDILHQTDGWRLDIDRYDPADPTDPADPAE